MKQRSDSIEESFSIPNDSGYVRKTSSRILKRLEPYKIDESILFDIRLCVEEMVRNAIQHGNLNDKNTKVKIDYCIDKDKFTIEIEDSGPGFDYKNLPDPTKENNIMKGSGRGVYLVQHLMDKIEFNDRGNKVTLTKYIR